MDSPRIKQSMKGDRHKKKRTETDTHEDRKIDLATQLDAQKENE